MVPKTIHRIWVGGDMPEQYRQYEDEWRRLHPGWDIVTWGDADLRWLTNQTMFDNAERYVPADAIGQFRSDIARYEILFKHGGIYVDCDVQPVKSFEPLLAPQAFAGWEEQRKFVGNTVLGSEADHAFFAKVIRELPDNAERHKGKAATWLSGPRFLTALYNEMSVHYRATIKMYPQSYFYPYSYSDLKGKVDPSHREYPDAYAIHHWQHQRDLKGVPLPRPKPLADRSLSIAVMAHRKREAWVPDLEKQLGPDTQVVWDQKNDRWDTGARSLMAFDPTKTHHLVVQDDALLPPDFVAGVLKMLRHVPDGHPVGLYYGRVRPKGLETERLVAKASQSKASFIVHNGPWWGVGIIVPTDQAAAVVNWGNNRSQIPNYDRRISRFYQSIGVDCYYTVPSLVEHRHGKENPSLVPGRTGTNRRAWQFVSKSALTHRWDGPVVKG